MNRNKIKLSILLIILSQMLVANFLMVQTAFAADYSGPESSIKQFLCTPSTQTTGSTTTGGGVGSNLTASFTASSTANAAQNNTAAGDLYVCINRLYRFAIILASSGAVLYIVIAGYMYMSSEGNSETVQKAKSYVTSAITAIVILMVGYVLLRTLNPDLIQFHNIQPPSVVPATTTPPNSTLNTPGGGAPTANPVASNVKDAATAILNLANQGKLSVNSTSCDCSGNCPINTLQSLAAGNQAQKDGPGTACNTGTTSVNVTMLNALISTANSGNSFSIGSITGGHHGNANNNVNDPHYLGNAVDVTPSNQSSGNQQSIYQSLIQNGATTVAIECSYQGTSVYWPIPSQASATDTRCLGQSNYHLHAQW